MSEPEAVDISAGAFPEEAPQVAPRIDGPLAVDSFLERSLEWVRSIATRAPLTRADVPDPSVAPWNAVALLNFYGPNGFTGSGTGFLYKRDALVTAGHNLVSRPRAVGVYPGYDSRRNPIGSVSGLGWAWEGARDVAVIIARPAVASLLQLGGAGTPGGITLAGYADSYPEGPRMSYAEARATAGTTVLTYHMKVEPGDSGAPVFVRGAGAPSAVAVHVRDEWDGPRKVGAGERIDSGLVDMVARLERAARAQVGG